MLGRAPQGGYFFSQNESQLSFQAEALYGITRLQFGRGRVVNSSVRVIDAGGGAG